MVTPFTSQIRVLELADIYLAPIATFLSTKHPDSLPPSFYIGGGCFKSLDLQKDCDIDLFASNWPNYNDGDSSAFVSRNAQTISVYGRSVQFCNYWKPSLQEMVNSFDFGHTQCGVEVTPVRTETGSIELKTSLPYFTEAWNQWVKTRRTSYTGTEYPLASLIRAGKLFKNEILSSKEYRSMLLEILVDVAERGFKDGEDFRNQLDAIDLGEVVNNKARAYALVELLKPQAISKL
jgi:hypothetical protein